MTDVTRRLVVRLISADALDQWMRFRGESNRSLADKVGKSPALIAHLRRGARTYCDSKLGPLIEKKLDVPRGSLFLPEMIVGSQSSNRNGRPAA